MSLIDTLVAFVPLLGILIFIHELGHFVVAKACGVRVLTFSLGFGSAIGIGNYRLRWERGGTEYVIAWIPLGGFVKMLGEEVETSDEEAESPAVAPRPDEYLRSKNIFQKLAICFAGPAMNLLFPIVIFVGLLMVGLPRAASVVGTVDPTSPAALAGIQVGDRLVSIDGTPMRYWSDVDSAVVAATTGALEVEAERDGANFTVTIPVVAYKGVDELGQAEKRGWIGIENERRRPLIAVPDPNSAAAQAGLVSGDLVVKVNEVETLDWNGFIGAFAASSGGPVVLGVLRGADAVDPLAIELPGTGTLEERGVFPGAVLVAAVAEGSAADDAGIQAGDLLLSLDGSFLWGFKVFTERVRASEGREFQLSYARKGEVFSVGLQPRLTRRDIGLANMTEDVFLVGIVSHRSLLPGAREIEQYDNPFEALPRAMELTWEMTSSFLRGLGLMFTGDVGMGGIAGPIGIAQVARTSLDYGFRAYLSVMMLISINLGIVNLLPIPVLDGGQALIYIVEGIKRSPISRRTRGIIQSVGAMAVLMLMAVALGNDIGRNWSSFLGWLRGEL